jgi:hypothetical protein
VPRDPRWEEAMYAQFRELGREAVSYVKTAAEDIGVEVEHLFMKGTLQKKFSILRKNRIVI